MKKIVSIHIPKCAGSALHQALKTAYGARMTSDYGDGVLRWDPKAIQRRRRTKSEMLRTIHRLDDTALIHGHFYATKYMDAPFDKEWITFVRHPVELLHSYYHWARRRQSGAGRALVNTGQELSIDEFIQHPQFSNIITRVTYPLEPEDFSFIGFQEVYHASLSALSLKLGIGLEDVFLKKRQESNARVFVRQDGSRLKLVEQFNALDLEWYERAKARAAALSLPVPDD